jgi:predicted PurR-regulated permease PerM
LSSTAKRTGGWIERRLSLDVSDPEPFARTEDFWRAAAQAATIVMCVLLLGTFLYVARPVLLPVLCAVVVALTFGPAIRLATTRGVPSWVMAMAVVVVVVGVTNVAVVMLAAPAADLLKRAPELGAAFKEKLHVFDQPLMAWEQLRNALGLEPSLGFDFNPGRLVEGLVTVVTPAAVQLLLQLVLFLGTLFFFILGRASFRQSAVNWFSTRQARLQTLKILNDVELNLSGYLIVVTAINLSLGLVTVAMTWAMGMPAPLLWGALAFTLNYIPYVGPGIMYVLLFVAGLLTYPTLLGALMPPAVFIAITLVEGQFLTPAIIGRQVLQVHPLVIFLGIAFWAWMWGPLGAFLATPILIVARVVLDHLYPREAADLPG